MLSFGFAIDGIRVIVERFDSVEFLRENLSLMLPKKLRFMLIVVLGEVLGDGDVVVKKVCWQEATARGMADLYGWQWQVTVRVIALES